MKPVQIKEYGKLVSVVKGRQPLTGETPLPEKAFCAVWDYLLESQGRDPAAGKAFKLFTRQGRKIIQAQNYAGLIQTSDGQVIEILPKIFSPSGELNELRSKDILIRMIAMLRDAPYINLQQASLDVRKDFPLLEIFISSFITECRKLVLTGLKKDYVPVERNSPFLKGRLLTAKDITVNLVNKSRFYIAFKEYNTDIPRNRIIKSAVLRLISMTVSGDNRMALRQLSDYLSGVPASADIDSDLRSSLTESRLFSAYTQLIEWSALFLKGNAFTPFAGSRVNHAILFPMERLFEDYIASLFRKHLKSMQVSTQHRKFSLVSSHRGKGRFGLRPDIYAESLSGPTRFYVMDTKWKMVDENQSSGNYLISQADMYQLYAYGHKYTSGAEEPRLLIIYPLNDRFRKPLQPFYYETTDGKTHLKLTAFPFDLSGDPSAQISAVTGLLDAGDITADTGTNVSADVETAQ